ncbi:MAG: DMT family transporter [Gammaproteobacteria bacterium]|nr:DMT family transporter [Gammaproteobacteria bacterium]MCB1922466.1 DMT family transporter [Gammaproteobacteria bacterium]
MLIRLVPLLFVLLWSTGFIGAKYALPYIEPFNLLFIRVVLTLVILSMLIRWRRSPWPSASQAGHQMVVGTLVHAGYLGGVFAAIKWQMPAGIAALIVGLQPLLTAVLGHFWLGTRLRPSQWLGLALGLLGIALVITNGELSHTEFDLQPAALAAIVTALFAISVGTLYQKRFGASTSLLTGSFYQYLATALVMFLLTQTTESGHIAWSTTLILALAWLILVLSIAAILLLMYMIREGEAARVASYFYLVPPITALEAWVLFDESLGLPSLLGMAVVVLGVYLALRARR